MEERLQKILSRCGYGSRRACEELITMGRVSVNGETAELGSKADPQKDVIRVDGDVLHYTEPEKVYIMLNKPRYVLSDRDSTDPRRSVYSLVDNSDGLFVVGRLDFESEGLILMTDNGDLVNRMMRVENGHEKEYLVTIDRPVSESFLRKMRAGVFLPDLGITTLETEAWKVDRYRFGIILKQGLNRQIRRMCEECGCSVKKLLRVRIMNITLGDLKEGEWRELTPEEKEGLLSQLYKETD